MDQYRSVDFQNNDFGKARGRLYEGNKHTWEGGKVTKVRKLKKKISVEEYLISQKRFKHMFSGKGTEEEIKAIQALADENIEKYGLLNRTNDKDREDQFKEEDTE